MSSGDNMLSRLFCSMWTSSLILFCHWSLVLTKASSVFQGNKGQGGVKGEKVRVAGTGVLSRRGRSTGSVFGLKTEQLRLSIWRSRGREFEVPPPKGFSWSDVTGPCSYKLHDHKVWELTAAGRALVHGVDLAPMVNPPTPTNKPSIFFASPYWVFTGWFYWAVLQVCCFYSSPSCACSAHTFDCNLKSQKKWQHFFLRVARVMKSGNRLLVFLQPVDLAGARPCKHSGYIYSQVPPLSRVLGLG